MKALIASLGCLALVLADVRADGPADNIPTKVRQIPPPGIEISPSDRERLEAGVAKLAGMIGQLRAQKQPVTDRYLPDVEIFARAVDQAVRFNEMFHPRDVGHADELLVEGIRRAERLAKNDPYWTRQRGLVVRGFRSKLDDTVQPYGLVIPPTYRDDIPYRYRTDIWFHGRGERSVELQFIHTRMTNPGQYQPEDTIVLHPFGRYSNAFKFAGEVDVFEALAHAKANYRIDDDRISVRGFSMGGAACWHFAVHYADRWFAANPGAGFSETPQFLQTFQGEVLQPTWWERTLWQWYDCPPWVENLKHCPTVAYSGELDRQKQAADLMADAYQAEVLTHIIGDKAAHSITQPAQVEIEARLESIDQLLLRENWFEFETYTLRYNKVGLITVNGLERHWNRSKIHVFCPTNGLDSLELELSNVTDISVDMPAGSSAANLHRGVINIEVGGERVGKTWWRSDRSLKARLYRGEDGIWKQGTPPWEGELRKRHGLQGPIDDALMDSFLFVVPGGTCRHPLVEEWTRAELRHAVTHWRQQMRGDVRIKADVDLTEEDITRHHLILWGDPMSNRVLGKIAGELPIQWGEQEVIVGDRKFNAEHHAPILIYPNPLNPGKYVVLNSSFTYREYDYLNNARQTPKLPDWAIVDLRVKPDTRWPGKIVDADFFDEKWELQPPYRERIKK